APAADDDPVPDEPALGRRDGAGVEPEPTADHEPADDDRLRRDLAEVGGSRPERAFNVGAVAGIAVTVAAAIFVVQNRGPAQFDWLWFDFEVPMWTALVGAVLAGVVLILTAVAVHRRRRRRIDRRREATRRLRRALGGDRTAPAT
ncbi:MAG TPA: lipopolysaccharide assembly protein LapA domain-containing protein, partial [Acidimicrobiales bacterium]